jgi:hypothetical protein
MDKAKEAQNITFMPSVQPQGMMLQYRENFFYFYSLLIQMTVIRDGTIIFIQLQLIQFQLLSINIRLIGDMDVKSYAF